MDIGFLLPQSDLTGPLQVLHRLPGARIHLLAKDLAPVLSDCGLGLVPTCALLARVGAIPTQGRVVRDGNLFTGGSVTAGIDFASSLAAELSSPEAAQRIQLALEYAAQLDQVVHPSANPSR